MMAEKNARGWSGWLMVFLLVVVLLGAVAGLIAASVAGLGPWIVFFIVVLAVDVVSFFGLTVVNPNQAKVVTLLGVYKGTLKEPGFSWVNPLTVRQIVSLRVRNFESGRLKVNDHDGNPIEIAAVVVWRVVETFEAMFYV